MTVPAREATSPGLNKTTVHRALAPLYFRGFVSQEQETGDDLLGPSATELADTYFSDENLPVLLHHALVALSGATDELVHLDVLDPEPPAEDDPLLTMDQVIVTPHALCWTADFTRDVATSVIEALIDVAHGRRPAHPVDPSALDNWRRGTRGSAAPSGT